MVMTFLGLMDLKKIIIISIICLIILSLIGVAFGEAKIFYSNGIIIDEFGRFPSYICDIYPWLSC